MILDGWGIGKHGAGDVIYNTPTPYLDYLTAVSAHAELQASGEDVGLPDGQMGNSEVGHLNIGAGRIVYQDLVKINRACKDGSIMQNPGIVAACTYAKENGKKLHLMGLTSDGGVHSSLDHLFKLIEVAKEYGLDKTFVHCFMDGRDTDPKSGVGFISQLTEVCAANGAAIASIVGRFYAMDRDKRWNRVKEAYDLLVEGKGKAADDLVKAMEEKGVGRPSTYAATISTIEDREYVVKEEKHLAPTALGEVVTGLMKDRFRDIIDVEFTANMENRLDAVEEGKQNWKDLLGEFYRDFEKELQDAETALEGVRLKVPEEETDEVCELCGRKMVIKMGRFGKFLACPGFPECKNAKPLVERMPGRCPKCGGGLLKRKSKRGFAYYACEQGAECGFMTWDVPTAEDCPECGQTLFKKSGRGRMKPFCVNENCSRFLPEDQRGYYKKKTEDQEAEAGSEAPAEKKPTKKTPAKKTAAKKTGAKKTPAKKTAAKKAGSTAKKRT